VDREFDGSDSVAAGAVEEDEVAALAVEKAAAWFGAALKEPAVVEEAGSAAE
jgi:hypothetical protein